MEQFRTRPIEEYPILGIDECGIETAKVGRKGFFVGVGSILLTDKKIDIHERDKKKPVNIENILGPQRRKKDPFNQLSVNRDIRFLIIEQELVEMFTNLEIQFIACEEFIKAFKGAEEVLIDGARHSFYGSVLDKRVNPERKINILYRHNADLRFRAVNFADRFGRYLFHYAEKVGNNIYKDELLMEKRISPNINNYLFLREFRITKNKPAHIK